VRAFPAGALEITDNATRFVPFTDVAQLVGALLFTQAAPMRAPVNYLSAADTAAKTS
jgi:hypothetical protein